MCICSILIDMTSLNHITSYQGHRLIHVTLFNPIHYKYPDDAKLLVDMITVFQNLPFYIE